MDEIKSRPVTVVHVVSGDLWAGAEVQTYTLLKQLSRQCKVYAVVLNPGTLAEKLTHANIETTILDESQQSAYSLLKHLIAAFRQIQPDVIHTHRIKENILGQLAGRLARLSKKTVFVKTVHGAKETSDSLKSQVLDFLDRQLTKSNKTRIISVSRELEPIVVNKNPGSSVAVIENGVDQEAIAQQLDSESATEESAAGVNVGFVGRLVNVKRVDLFLKAIPHVVAATNTPYRFHIIGDGPLLNSLKRLAAELSVEQHLRFHSHRSDMPAFLKHVDVVVMCSDHEGTPMTVLEAIAMRRKLVLHDTGGLTSIAKLHQVTPYSPNDPETLARAILNAEMPTTLHETYTIERCADATFQYYIGH